MQRRNTVDYGWILMLLGVVLLATGQFWAAILPSIVRLVALTRSGSFSYSPSNYVPDFGPYYVTAGVCIVLGLMLAAFSPGKR